MRSYPANRRGCPALSFRAGHLGGPMSAMLIVQEDGKLRSYGLATRRNRLLEEAILHVLRQVTPNSDNGLT
jgi:hypothetical protein